MPTSAESLGHRFARPAVRLLPAFALAAAVAAGARVAYDGWRQFQSPPAAVPVVTAAAPSWAAAAGTIADARLFGGDAATEAPVAALDIRLKGVFAGQPGAAIVTVNGRDRSAAVGAEVLPGIRLVSVEPRSITVQRSGALQRVALDEPQRASGTGSAVAQAKPQTAPTVGAPAAAPPARDPLSERRARRGEAYAPVGDVTTEPAPATVSPPPPPKPAPAAPAGGAPRSGVPATDVIGADSLTRYGLQPGDLIQSVNGRPVSNRLELARLAAELKGQPVSVQIARGTEVVSVQFTTP